MHVVCEWIGNTPKVASEHYLRVTEDDYAKANGGGDALSGKWDAPGDAPAVHKSAAAGMRQGGTDRIAQNGTLLQFIEKALKNDGLEQVCATLSKAVQSRAIDFEYPRQDSNL